MKTKTNHTTFNVVNQDGVLTLNRQNLNLKRRKSETPINGIPYCDNVLFLQVNNYIAHKTKIDIRKNIDDLFQEGELTEHSLLFELGNYPGAGNPKELTLKDKLHLRLFYKYGLQKIDEYDKNKKDDDATVIGFCSPGRNIDDYDNASNSRYNSCYMVSES